MSLTDLQYHKLIYLLNQLDDDNFGIEICLQHLTGQALLSMPRYHLVGDRPHPWQINTRARLALQATLASGLIFPVILLFIR